MSKSRQSGSSHISEIEARAAARALLLRLGLTDLRLRDDAVPPFTYGDLERIPDRPKLDESLDRDARAMERVAGALEVIGDALTMQAKLDQQRFEIEHPTKPERRPVSVFEARYRTPRDEENKGVELEDEIEIDKATGKAKIKPGVTFYEEPKARGTAASRRRS